MLARPVGSPAAPCVPPVVRGVPAPLLARDPGGRSAGVRAVGTQGPPRRADWPRPWAGGQSPALRKSGRGPHIWFWLGLLEAAVSGAAGWAARMRAAGLRCTPASPLGCSGLLAIPSVSRPGDPRDRTSFRAATLEGATAACRAQRPRAATDPRDAGGSRDAAVPVGTHAFMRIRC